MIQQRVRDEVERASDTLRAAGQADSASLKLQLARQAIFELITAYTLSRSDRTEEPESVERSLARLAALPAADRHAEAIARLREHGAVTPGERLEYDSLVRLFGWLQRFIDVRTPRELSARRWGFRAIALLALLPVAWLVATPKNLALGARVSASSSCGLAPEPPLGGEALARAVDGRRNELTFAACTKIERAPWVTVDLGRMHRIDRVVVYPRNDCCYGDDELPVSLQLSPNNAAFETAGERSAPATIELPWRFATGGREARYIRITTGSDEPRHVVLSEVEVYGS